MYLIGRSLPLRNTPILSPFDRSPASPAKRRGCTEAKRCNRHRPQAHSYVPGLEDCALERLVTIESNLDDFSPQLLPPVMDRLLAAGALDVWVVQGLMKKGRPALFLHVLTRPEQQGAMARIVLEVSTRSGLLPGIAGTPPLTWMASCFCRRQRPWASGWSHATGSPSSGSSSVSTSHG